MDKKDVFKFIQYTILQVFVLNIPIIEVTRTVHETKMNISVRNGSTAELSCPIDIILNRKELDTLTWIRSPRQLLTKGVFRVTENQRIFLAPMDLLKTKALSLYLRPTLPEDKGEYRCTLTLKDAIHVHTVFLNVSVPPTIIKSPVPYLKVDEGAVLELNCLANGDPPPQVTWKIHSNPLVTEDKGEHKLLSIYEAFSELGVPINHNNGTLVIGKLHRKMNRRFVCLATNGVQPDDQSEVFLSVRFSPEVKMTNRVIKQGIGMNTVLTCQVSAHPPGSIRWLFNHHYPIAASSCDVMTNAEKKYCLQEHRPQSYNSLSPITSKLAIFNLQAEDFGDYVCSVSTIMGEAFGVTTLQRFKNTRFGADLLQISNFIIDSNLGHQKQIERSTDKEVITNRVFNNNANYETYLKHLGLQEKIETRRKPISLHKRLSNISSMNSAQIKLILLFHILYLSLDYT
uniref:Ig-like domain-containing protein n=1 Tax=Trichobilharzia regenti TaxID=157069 RepID=A0AA85K3Q7_TRIRE|nr:unnamed protein product [Trichobilharzia regenti]